VATPVKVVLITGSLPPEYCGVGDYTARLANALNSTGASAYAVSLRGSSDHPLQSLPRLRAWLGTIQPDIIHLQYPGAAFKKSLFPLSLASSLKPSVLTLHEYGISHPFRKGMMRFLVRRSASLIFPSPDVAASVPKDVTSGKPTDIIPVGPAFEPEQVPDIEPLTRIPLLHFGFINRSRSFEDWGVLLSLLNKHHPETDVFFITGTPERSVEAVVTRERLKERAPSIRVQWLHQARSDAISRFLLQHPAIAYLPFVDGLSERRTSLITLLAHGIPCLVSPPRVSPLHLTQAEGLVFVDTPETAHSEFGKLQDPARYRAARADAVRQSQAFSWPSIAERHLRFYTSL
jgi:glycosyltransferase involved in cell wall biosynthesis